ncbi:DUF3829 domain-containing protein [Pedobacter miscanthi]|uniref:DUF3829 domain-containing protein n=1 Tax=Pedobacter miscanthi TaxID=2259170 RepID=A0A366L496_9SPHI|nr:DUF3829 domain-containing protein [Pedobacter miscanthi]RBQ08711.1 hypothetical protein DRW42_08360 [Pedobacter miscanthi]
MKTLFKLTALALVLSVTACKNGGKKDSNGKTTYVEADEKDVNAIIEYNNVMVSFTDKNNSYLKSLESNLDRIEKGLAKPNDRFAFLGLMTPFSMSTFSNSKIKPDTPPSALSSDDQKFFKENVVSMTGVLDKIKATYKSLDEYIKAEDWKDDKGVKGKALVDSIYSMGKKYYTYDEVILAKLNVIGDDAERVILKTHPLKEYIFALKDDRSKVAEFTKLLASNKNYKAIEAKAKTAYQSLEDQYNKQVAMPAPDATKFPGKDGYFKNFNESLNDYLIAARKMMRDASASGKLTEYNIEELVRKQDSMRSAYNNFVD